MKQKPKRPRVQVQDLTPPPFVEGLTAVVVSPALLGHACDLYAREFSTGKHRSKGMRTEPCAVVSMYGGGGQVVEKAKNYALAMAPPNRLKYRTFRADGDTRHFEYASNEGLKTLEMIAKRNEGSVLTFQALSIPTATLQSVMQKLRSLGRRYKVSFMMFLAWSSDAPVDVVLDNCDQLIKVREAEGDPDAQKAFIIEDAEMDGLSLSGESRVMCQIFKRDDNLYQRSFTPYVADGLRERFMRELSGHGYKQTQLATIWGVDPSTISRVLNSMSRIKSGSFPMEPARMQMLAEHFGVELPVVGEKEPMPSVDEPDEWPDEPVSETTNVTSPSEPVPALLGETVSGKEIDDDDDFFDTDENNAQATSAADEEALSWPATPARAQAIKPGRPAAKKKRMSPAAKRARRALRPR